MRQTTQQYILFTDFLHGQAFTEDFTEPAIAKLKLDKETFTLGIDSERLYK